ncbi:MAG: CHC2 zinc finger domain-containing protein [Acidobacteriota bacterium]|nr:CHC2 zinc finger domain-containing protein [Acidobacteriota bacterium]
MLEPLFALRNQAEFYHRQLPEKARRYLNSRGVPDTFIERYVLGWNGSAITVPVENETGEVVLLRKILLPTEGAHVMKRQSEPRAELYPWSTLRRDIGRVVIAANELDCLALEARGFLAVCSTGGVNAFNREWVKWFESVDCVYICFDRSTASKLAAENVKQVIPRAIIVSLPEELGEGGDVGDCIERLGYTRNDFEALFARASCDPITETDDAALVARFVRRAARVKAAVPIAKVVADYTALRGRHNLVGRCPLHRQPEGTLQVFPETDTFKCLFCGAAGDAIDFLQIVEGLTYGQALEALEKIQYSDEQFDVA